MKILSLLLIVFNFSFLLGCSPTKTEALEYKTLEKEEVFNSEIKSVSENKIEIEKVEKDIKEPEIYEASLVAVGDNLIHSMVIKSGVKDDGSRDYNYIYEDISPYINEFDIKVINQETMFINDSSKYSGYPTFGSPIQVGEAVINSGFNLVTNATNHSFDKREEGINDTINFWKENQIDYLGLHENIETFNKPLIKEYNNISFAFSNYTYGLNGFILPSDKEYLVNTFMSDSTKQLMLNNIKEASNLVDFNVVFVHWGVEYTIDETEGQRLLAKEIAEAGADIIIGTHPHVVEPLKYIECDDGRIVPVYYSLGNFVSNQDRLDTMLGGAAEIKFVKEDGNCYIKDLKLVPLVTHIEQGQRYFKVYKLENYTEELASKHKLRTNGLTLEFLQNRFLEITSKNENRKNYK